TIRVERERVTHAYGRRCFGGRQLPEQLPRQPCRLDAGFRPRLEVASERFLIITIRDDERYDRLQPALDVQTTQQRGSIQRGTPPALERHPCGTKAVRLLDIAKGRTRFRQQQTSAAAGTASTDTFAFEN